MYVRRVGDSTYLVLPGTACRISYRRLKHSLQRDKGRCLTQSYDKSPFTHRKIQKATWKHKNATKNFDNTTIADQLRTVSLSNSSHPTGVIKPVYERTTFPLTATAMYSNGHTSYIVLSVNLRMQPLYAM